MAELFPLPCISFLAMIGRVHELLGPATARLLINVGKELGETSGTLETLQGPAEEVKANVFVQRRCPFADATRIYKEQGVALPSAVKTLAAEAPNYGTVWVSAFCGVHQALRQAKDATIKQVACKAGDGSVNYAPDDVVSEEEANAVLKEAACIYRRKA